jgi:hypothetical protein
MRTVFPSSRKLVKMISNGTAKKVLPPTSFLLKTNSAKSVASSLSRSASSVNPTPENHSTLNNWLSTITSLTSALFPSLMISRISTKLSVKSTSLPLLKRRDSLSSEKPDASSRRKKTNKLPKPRPSKTKLSAVDLEERKWERKSTRTPPKREIKKRMEKMKTILIELLKKMARKVTISLLTMPPLLMVKRPSL